MNAFKKLFLPVALLALFLVHESKKEARAAEDLADSDLAWVNNISLTTTVNYVSKYLWRGFDLLEGDPAIQPDFYFDLGGTGFYLDIWHSRATQPSKWEIWDEWDYSLGYGNSLWKDADLQTDYGLSYTYYDYPQLDKFTDSQEVMLGLKWPKILESAGLTPYCGLYGSFAAHDNETDQNGWWFKVGTNYSIAAPKLPCCQDEQTLTAYLESFVNDGAASFGVEPGWSHIATGLSTTWTWGSFSLTPAINYQWTLEDEVNPDDEFWFTLSAAATLF